MPTASRNELSTAWRPSHAPAASVMDGGILQRRTIVLAMKGGPEGAAATCVVAALAGARGARPMVIRAYFAAPAFAMATPSATVRVANAVDATRNGVRHELLCASPTAGEWPIRVVAGAPSDVIATTAREMDAALIVMGLHARSGVGPTIRAETTLRLIRDTEIPVLAITASLSTLPKRILVRVDFGQAGLRAARAALALLTDGGALNLVFVDTLPRPTTEDGEGDERMRRQGAVAACERLREALAAPTQISVSTTILEGVPSKALRALAERTDADVIAISSRRHGVVDPLLLGSVAADLVHDARWSLLIVPPHETCP